MLCFVDGKWPLTGRSLTIATWIIGRTQPPLSQPDSGFGQLEVMQVEVIAGQPVKQREGHGLRLGVDQAGGRLIETGDRRLSIGGDLAIPVPKFRARSVGARHLLD
jgi:hypothetical protein